MRKILSEAEDTTGEAPFGSPWEGENQKKNEKRPENVVKKREKRKKSKKKRLFLDFQM